MPAPGGWLLLFQLPWTDPDWVGKRGGISNDIFFTAGMVDVVIGIIIIIKPDIFMHFAATVFSEEAYDVDEVSMLMDLGYVIMVPGWLAIQATRMNSEWLPASQFFLRIIVQPLTVAYGWYFGYCRTSSAIVLLVPNLFFSLLSWLEGTSGFLELLVKPFETPVPQGPSKIHHTFSLITAGMYFATAASMLFLPYTFSKVLTIIFFEYPYSDKGIRGFATMGAATFPVAYAWPTLMRTRSHFLLSHGFFARLFLVPLVLFGYCTLVKHGRFSIGLLFALFDPSLCLVQHTLWRRDGDNADRDIDSSNSSNSGPGTAVYDEFKQESRDNEPDPETDRRSRMQRSMLPRFVATAVFVSAVLAAAAVFCPGESLVNLVSQRQTISNGPYYNDVDLGDFPSRTVDMSWTHPPGHSHELPKNQKELQQAGWTKHGSKCVPGIGYRWSEAPHPTRNKGVQVYTTKGGQISGFSVDYWGQIPEPLQKYFTLLHQGSNMISTLIVATRKGNIICNGTVEADHVIGNALILCPGCSGNKSSFELGLKEEWVKDNGWVSGSCIPGMGTHWFLDTFATPGKITWQGDGIFPIVPMYDGRNKELVSVFFFSPTMSQNSTQWDMGGLQPKEAFCVNTCDLCSGKFGVGNQNNGEWADVHIIFRPTETILCPTNWRSYMYAGMAEIYCPKYSMWTFLSQAAGPLGLV